MMSLNEGFVIMFEANEPPNDIYMKSLNKHLPSLFSSLQASNCKMISETGLEFYISNPVFFFRHKIQLHWHTDSYKQGIKYSFDFLAFIWIVLILFILLALLPGQEFGSLLKELSLLSVFLLAVFLVFTHGNIRSGLRKWKNNILPELQKHEQNAHATRFQNSRMIYKFTKTKAKK